MIGVYQTNGCMLRFVRCVRGTMFYRRVHSQTSIPVDWEIWMIVLSSMKRELDAYDRRKLSMRGSNNRSNKTKLPTCLCGGSHSQDEQLYKCGRSVFYQRMLTQRFRVRVRKTRLQILGARSHTGAIYSPLYPGRLIRRPGQTANHLVLWQQVRCCASLFY